jgi:hypothetical protein
LSVALQPFDGTIIALDIEDITSSSDNQTRIHFGLEQTAQWNTFAIRLGGFNQ